MRLKKISIDKNIFVIVYKLSYDLLLLLLVTFASALVMEGLLPGIISSKISFSKITMLLVAVLALIIYLGKQMHLTYDSKTKINKNKVLPALVLSMFLLIGNSLLNFTLLENFVITLATLLILFLFYELIFASKND